MQTIYQIKVYFVVTTIFESSPVRCEFVNAITLAECVCVISAGRYGVC